METLKNTAVSRRGLESAPLKDLCALGGCKSPQTVLTRYQRADSASMQQALAARRRLEA